MTASPCRSIFAVTLCSHGRALPQVRGQTWVRRAWAPGGRRPRGRGHGATERVGTKRGRRGVHGAMWVGPRARTSLAAPPSHSPLAAPTRRAAGSHSPPLSSHWEHNCSDWERDCATRPFPKGDWGLHTGDSGDRRRLAEPTGRQGRQLAGASRRTGGRLASPTGPLPFGEATSPGATRPRDLRPPGPTRPRATTACAATSSAVPS